MIYIDTYVINGSTKEEQIADLLAQLEEGGDWDCDFNGENEVCEEYTDRAKLLEELKSNAELLATSPSTVVDVFYDRFVTHDCYYSEYSICETVISDTQRVIVAVVVSESD